MRKATAKLNQLFLAFLLKVLSYDKYIPLLKKKSNIYCTYFRKLVSIATKVNNSYLL